MEFEDLAKWDAHIAHCDSLDQLSAAERDAAKEAFAFCRGELGESFLATVYETAHPLVNTLSNLAPWSRLVIVDLATALRDLRARPRYSLILEKLKRTTGFAGALSTLEVAHAFSMVGFDIAFEPPVTVKGRPKVADLEIIHRTTGERAFVEVSVCRTSSTSANAMVTLNDVLLPLLVHRDHGLVFAGRVLKRLSEPHRREISAQALKLADRVSETRALQTLEIARTIVLGIAPESASRELEEWASTMDLRPGDLSGPPIDTNEVNRTGRQIHTEQAQLPTDTPGVVVLWNNALFFDVRNTDDAAAVASELEENVYAYPHVALVAVAGRVFGGTEPIEKELGPHRFIIRMKARVLEERRLVLQNRFCTVPISSVAFGGMVDALRQL